MRIDPQDPVFSAAYHHHARNADIIDLLLDTADDRPFAGAGNALLVPVDVQALHVRDGDEVRADAGVRLLDADSFEGEVERTSEPFTDAPPLEPGVHLHWAMPDGLTAGATSPDGTMDLSPLPDRWLVVRLLAGPTRRWSAWVVESDFGRSWPLRSWDGEPEQPGAEPPPGWVPRAQLTAAAGGDPAWAAVYDNVRDRFAFHDPLQGVEPADGPVTYTVVGWYGDQSLDPLADVRSGAAFDAALARLRWAIDADAREELSRTAALLALLPVITSWEGSRGGATPAGEAGSGGGLQVVEAGASHLGRVTGATSAGPIRVDEDVDVVAKFPPRAGPWPRRCVLHGAVLGVDLASTADNRPASHAVTLAAGATATEGMATLVGAAQPDAGTAEVRATAAFAYGVLDRLTEHDGPAQVDEVLHMRAFTSRPGGFTYDHVRRGDPMPRRSQPTPSRGPKGVIEGRWWEGQVKDAVVGLAEQSYALEGTLAEAATGRARSVIEAALALDDAAGGVGAAARAGLGDAVVDRADAVISAGRDAATSTPAEAWRATFEFSEHRARLGVPRHTVDQLRAAVDRLAEQRIEKVRRPLPRWYQPQDPVLTVQGTSRNLRHGHDGRFTPDETTACRLRAGICDEWEDVRGEALLQGSLRHASLPPEAAELVHEVVLEDVSNTDGLVEALGPDYEALVRGEHVIGVRGRQPDVDASVLADASTREGTLSSPVALTLWDGQPWIPLYLEWDAELELGDRTAAWQLGELDLDPPDELPQVDRVPMAGRSLLASATVKALAAELSNALEQESLEDVLESGGALGSALEATLRDVLRAASDMDVLAAGLDGLRDRLLGRGTNVVLEPREDGAPPAGTAAGGPPAEPLATGDALLAAAGTILLRRVRVVDAYGRTLDVPVDGLLTSETLTVPADVTVPPPPADPDAPVDGEADADAPRPSRLLMRPRVNLPTRLLLRLVDAEDDDREVAVDHRPTSSPSPVCGWLVADHVDHAVEVFDAAGGPVGQLRHDAVVAPDVGGAVVWEGTPGRPGPLGVSPGEVIENRHVRAFVTRLVERDLARRESPDAADRESPLAALLRLLDATQWTVDPVTSLGWEFPAALVGRPLALVRARVTLQIATDLDDERWADLPDEAVARRRAVVDRLRSREFEVRLGSLTRLQDGLFGYVVDDDYWHLHPVHPAVLDEALPTGPGVGYQQDADSAAGFDPAADGVVVPIRDPYLVGDPTITIRPGQTRTLTLLMDPGLGVHVTTGILPRKEITLLREWVEAPVRAIAPSFRVGPVLVEPDTIRIPTPGGMPGAKHWTRRDSPTTWRDDPIEAASQQALLPDGAHVAQEGWIRLVYEETSGG